MEVIEPLKYCRYYKGEDKVPANADEIQETFWRIEHIWVTGVNPYEITRDNYVAEFSMDYPKGIPSADIPISLKATIYNQYCHFNTYKDGFIDFIRLYKSSSL